MTKKINSSDSLWQDFAEAYDLTAEQVAQYQHYYRMLCTANELFNITAITELRPALAYHFADSLELGKKIDFSTIQTVTDVGTGGGFPGLVLKIKYPHLKVTLIEVNLKKCAFLTQLAQELGLVDVTVDSQDWRTFLRKTTESVDLVCSRASLHPDELLRMFKPSSPYRAATLVYWASEAWEPTNKEKPYVAQEIVYHMKHKVRKYIFFKNISST